MTRYRFLAGLFLGALAVLFALVGSSFKFPLWIIVSPVILLCGFWLGRLLPRRYPAVGGPGEHQKEDTRGLTPMDLSADLLDVTVNEMREGLLVIDAEMRVVASNRAARDLFSHVEDRINLRTLTEVTRNPAVYDAFLDGVRGTERAGVKVETYGPTKRIFDLRVVPLRSGNGRDTAGAVGVFFDITRLERLELVRQEFLSNVSHELRTP